MKLAVGCDPAGFELKGRTVEHLEARGHQVIDAGCHSTESAAQLPQGMLIAAS
jgi:ribose 5-phosphate isomerase B